MTRRPIVAIGIAALLTMSLAPGVLAELEPPTGKDQVFITTAKVDRAGNAIVDFQVTCDYAMRGVGGSGEDQYPWSVRVDQYFKKGGHAFGSVGPVQYGYFCKPGSPMSPHDTDQFVENGALLIRPGWAATEFLGGSAPFAAGYVTVSINIGWTACDGATDWLTCDAIIAAQENDAYDETPMWDAFWSYQTVKLVRSR